MPTPAAATRAQVEELAAKVAEKLAAEPPANEVHISNPPFFIGQVQIAKLVATPLRFVDFVKCIREAHAEMKREGGNNAGKYVNRQRMLAQLQAVDSDGKSRPLTALDVMLLPRAYAMKAIRALDASLAGDGEAQVITDADGISAPLLFKLAMPLKMRTPEGEFDVPELEFEAKTLGDIEDVIASDGPADQALALLRKCAKPVGGDVTISELPEWAIAQVSVADGLMIMDKVLPRFLDYAAS